MKRPEHYATMDRIEYANTIHGEIAVYKLSLGHDSVRGRVNHKSLRSHFRSIAEASIELYETYKAIGPDWQSYVFGNGSGIFL
jgi:hypothetical protein